MSEARRIVTEAHDRPVILFNPRLARCFVSFPLNFAPGSQHWSVLCLSVLGPCTSSDIVLCMCSGDVGLGLNVRRMRNEFLSLFTVTYSLRPLGESASVFRRYPGQWKVRSQGCDAPDPCPLTLQSLPKNTALKTAYAVGWTTAMIVCRSFLKMRLLPVGTT